MLEILVSAERWFGLHNMLHSLDKVKNKSKLTELCRIVVIST